MTNLSSSLVILGALFLAETSFSLDLESEKSKNSKILKDIFAEQKSEVAKPRARQLSGNLPSYSRRSNLTATKGNSTGSVIPKKTVFNNHKEIKVGDIISARIIQNMKAVKGDKYPVRAVVTKGKYKGSLFIGEYSLNMKSRKASVEFSLFRDKHTLKDYALRAVALGADGEEGIEGRFVSNKARGFWASVLSNFVSGAARGTVQYSKNVLGNYEKAPGFDTAAREGVAEASEKVAKKYEREVDREPVYTEIKGPIAVQLFITDELKSIN
ncbi:MAG: hypothetical protein CL677_00275 [Bdellovibrionaceae bacterium]|mgnify:CR=1 FL=1|nr:hypothetical protein [Pseudobdellovibrionaceae bacterium]